MPPKNTSPCNRNESDKTLLRKFSLLFSLVLASLLMGLTFPAGAALTIEPITWGVVGLDSNDVNTGPNQFPVGARICTESGDIATIATVTFAWDTIDNSAFIDLRAETLSFMDLNVAADGGCADAYFQAEITRDSEAYGKARNFTITATDGSTTVSTPSPRELYVEHLVSQSRNEVTEMHLSTDGGSTWNIIGEGATMSLMVGQTYHIKLVASTATNGYEQIESFINFPNIIFQVLSVNTSYGAPADSSDDVLYGNACDWDSNPLSANYLSCLDTGKLGGDIVMDYEVKILQVPDAPLFNPQPLETLVYDFSGSSFHYNANYSSSTRYAKIVNAAIDKSFASKNINPDDTSVLTFTIANPGPEEISGVNFVDNLPAWMVLANTAVNYSGCGTPLPSTGTVITPLAFSGITVAGLGECTIEVFVTSSANGTYENTTNNLFIGIDDTGSSATDTLVVSSKPLPPSTCPIKTAMAEWDMPTSGQGSGGPPPPYTLLGDNVSRATAIATLGTGSQSIVPGNATNAWQIQDAWVDTLIDPGVLSGPYFQFNVDSSNYGGVAIEFTYALQAQGDWASGTNNHLYIYSSHDGVSYSLAGTINAGKGSWVAVGPTTASASGVSSTWFRIVANTRNGSKADAQVLLDDIVISGCPRPDVPTLSKSFSPSTIAEGSSSTLTFTFENPNVSDLTGVGFSDTLPSGLRVAAVPNVTGPTCTGTASISGATIVATAGETLIDMSGGILVAGALGNNCSFTVDIEGEVAGNYTNTSDSITSTETGPNTIGGPNVGYGVDSLTVVAPPVISKAFGANSILTGSTTTLSFAIANPNLAGIDLIGVAFTDFLPAGVDVATSLLPACNGGTLTTTDNGSDPIQDTVALSGGYLQAGDSCFFSVNVTGSTAGSKHNEVTVTSTIGGAGNTASADLLVKAPVPGLAFSKKVGSSATGPWVNSMVAAALSNVWYLFTLENTGDEELELVSITDDTYDVSACNIVGTLPVADANDDDHIRICVLGPVVAQIGTVINIASVVATGGISGAPVVPPDDTATYTNSPTAVTIGKVDLQTLTATDFIAGLGADQMEAESLLALLSGWDYELAATLTDADRDTVIAALHDYLDPDGDGQLAVLRWDTLEERGTIGFFVERRQGTADWQRIHEEMLPALITAPMGGEYQLVDPGALTNEIYQYQLIEQEAWGTTRTYGPYNIEMGQ